MNTLYVIENQIGLNNFLIISIITLIMVIVFKKRFKNENKDD